MRKRSHRRRWVITSLLCGMSMEQFGFAQDYRSRIEGVVVDPTDATILGAIVTLRNLNTGATSAIKTDSAGRYIFEYILPGEYSLGARASGFSPYLREPVAIQSGGGLYANIQMKIGEITDSVTVIEKAEAVLLNATALGSVVGETAATEMPVLARNPFTLALLNPAVVNRYWDVAHRNPFFMWSSNGLDIGGSTGGKNDLLLDGVPLGYAARGSYGPPMDAVQELAVEQNAVEAEFGFSAGGILSLAMKTGTNDRHGTAYYLGRNPKLNAMTNRISREPSVVRNSVWGGTFGGAIKKNKIFTYGTYEQWRSSQPQRMNATLPTDAERQGDFSHSLTPSGGMRLIYDPFTTRFVPESSTVVRAPFPNNTLPAARIDTTARKIMNDLWKPNNPGDDLTGVGNYKKTYPSEIKYWNISQRFDWTLNEQWRTYFRFSKFETRLDNPNHGGTIAVPSETGGLMDALNAAADVLYMPSSRTTVNFRFGATYLEDDFNSEWAKVPESVWKSLWPTGWFKPVLDALPATYYPAFTFQGNGRAATGRGNWYQVHGRMHDYQSSLSHDHGIHRLKLGLQFRRSFDHNGSPGPGGFVFRADDTAKTFINPDVRDSGNMYASLLVGAVSSGDARISSLFRNSYQQWGLYIQDDLQLSRRVTLNLGMRWELETGPRDKDYQFSRNLDLSDPIPEFQRTPPQIPLAVRSLANIDYQWSGAFRFTSPDQPRIYRALWNLLPRVGLALRLDNSSIVRVAWTRYAVPMKGAWTEGFSLPRAGYSELTSTTASIEGRPQTLISDPFPASNPVRTPVGNALGRYTNLGNPVDWYNPNPKRPINDRLNFSYQRMLPKGILSETTFFANFGHNSLGTSMWGGDNAESMNLMDPALAYRYKAEIDQAVSNPFYNILPKDKFPGSLGNRQTVTARELLSPYPQYGSLNQHLMPGWYSRYYALQIRLERRFSNGLSFLAGYSYNREQRSEWFSELDQYQGKLTLIDSREPRHQLRLSGIYEIPLGRGRKFLANTHPIVDAVLGGWSTSHLLTFHNGGLLTFEQAIVRPGNPTIENPTPDRWFDTSVFRRPEAYTPRINPWFYNGLRGPRFWSLDSTIVKSFRLTERANLELRMEFYNLPNTFIPSDPETDVNSSTFGKSTWVALGNYGREIQYSVRIRF